MQSQCSSGGGSEEDALIKGCEGDKFVTDSQVLGMTGSCFCTIYIDCIMFLSLLGLCLLDYLLSLFVVLKDRFKKLAYLAIHVRV